MILISRSMVYLKFNPDFRFSFLAFFPPVFIFSDFFPFRMLFCTPNIFVRFFCVTFIVSHLSCTDLAVYRAHVPLSLITVKSLCHRQCVNQLHLGQDATTAIPGTGAAIKKTNEIYFQFKRLKFSLNVSLIFLETALLCAVLCVPLSFNFFLKYLPKYFKCESRKN